MSFLTTTLWLSLALLYLSTQSEAFVIRTQITQINKPLTLVFDTDPKDDQNLHPIIVERGGEADPFSAAEWDEIEQSAPSEWEVMKELLGINIFTYILAALIVVLLSLNVILGPGWLGQSFGLQGTGTFTEVSPNIPQTVDLSNYGL